MIEKLKSQNIWVIAAAGVVLIGLIVGGFFGIKAMVDARRNESAPLFSYAGDKSWKSNETKKESLTLFSESTKEQGSKCFVHIEYMAGTLDPAAEITKYTEGLRKGGHPTEALATRQVKLTTSNGDKQYDLQQFKVANLPDFEPIMESAQIGYVKLSDGYVRVVGNCDTPDQLPMTIPVLEAITYRKS